MEALGAEILVESLKSVGVKVIFGVSGSPTLSVLDVLYRTPEIRYIQAQHEQNAMYMANGYARQSREVGVCLVSSGPAETNCVSPVAQAYYTSTPSILLAAVEGSKFIGLGPSIHHDVDAPRVFAPVTKLAVRVERKDRMQEILQRAFVTAMAGRKGPCFVAIPKDFLKEKMEVDQSSLQVYRQQPPRGNPREIESVATLLQEANRPFILVGGGINWSGAHKELIQLAELLSIPVANTKGHTGIFPADHPLSLGTLRPQCVPPTLYAYYNADLIVSIGNSFAYCVDTGFGLPVPKTAKVVHIDIDPLEIGKIVPVNAAVVADAKLVLQDLLEVLREQGQVEPRSETEWTRELSRQKAAWAERILPLQTSNKTPIQTYRLMSDLRKVLPRNAIVAGDSGGTGTWFDHCFSGLVPTTVGGWHPLGAEFCEAMGVKVAAPQVPVVCITGDGSMMMSLQEWATAVANNIPLICVVQHNGVFGNMHYEQITKYGGRFLGTDLPIPNLANMAREFGAYAERVEVPDEIVPAVERALEARRPALLEFMVDTAAENLVPPKNKGERQ